MSNLLSENALIKVQFTNARGFHCLNFEFTSARECHWLDFEFTSARECHWLDFEFTSARENKCSILNLPGHAKTNVQF